MAAERLNIIPEEVNPMEVVAEATTTSREVAAAVAAGKSIPDEIPLNGLQSCAQISNEQKDRQFCRHFGPMVVDRNGRVEKLWRQVWLSDLDSSMHQHIGSDYRRRGFFFFFDLESGF